MSYKRGGQGGAAEGRRPPAGGSGGPQAPRLGGQLCLFLERQFRPPRHAAAIRAAGTYPASRRNRPVNR